MRKLIIPGFLVLLIIFGFQFQSSLSCDKAALTAACKKKMEPYKYDNQKFTKVTYKSKPQELEIEAPVFIGEKYRIVFNTSALTKAITINVYTKGKENEKRQPIYSVKTVKSGENIFSFDAPRTRKMFINYSIPASSDTTTVSECVVYMMGYDLVYK